MESYWSGVHTVWADRMTRGAQRMEWEDNVTGNYENTSRYVDNGGMLYFHSDMNKEDKKSIQELPTKCPLSVPLWSKYILSYNESWFASRNLPNSLFDASETWSSFFNIKIIDDIAVLWNRHWRNFLSLEIFLSDFNFNIANIV